MKSIIEMHDRSRAKRALASLWLALSVLACGGRDEPAAPSETGSSEAASSAKVFYGFRTSAHKSLDPMKQFDQASSEIISSVYDTLLEYHYLDRPYRLVPNLLEKMPEPQPDGVSYVLTLRRGVKFNDDPVFPDGVGRELTIDDVIYSIKRFADANVNLKSYILLQGFVEGLDEFRAETKRLGRSVSYDDVDVSGIEKLDDYRMSIRFTRRNPLAFYPFAAQNMAVVCREAVDHYGDELESHPVGTGPFYIRDFSRRGKMVLAKNPNYHGTYPTEGAEGDRESGLLIDAGRPLPLIDEVQLPLIEESQPAMLKFRNGEIDWIGMNKDDFIKMATRDDEGTFRLKPEYASKFQMYTEPGLSAEYFVFNTKDELVGHNKSLRQAIALAIDTQEFLHVLRNDRGLPLYTIVPHPIAGSQNDIDFEYYVKDVERAKQKLAEAGYPGGQGLPEISIEYRAATKDTRQEFEFIRNELAQVGIRLKANFQTFSAFLKRVESGNFQMASAGWAADFPDGENFYQLLYSENHVPGPNSSFFAHDEFDRLYRESRFMENGPERFEYFRKMSEIVKDEVPILLRYNNLAFGLYQQRVGNMKRNIMIDKPYKYLSVDREASAASG